MTYTPNPDNTNTVLLMESRLGPYTKSVDIYKCPADRSMAPVGSRLYPRVRSVAMNSYVGGVSYNNPAFIIHRKSNDFRNPSKVFVILDEREDSIDDAFFATDMTQWRLVNMPASYHGRAGSFSFADGHSEIHRWRDDRTMPPMAPGVRLAYNIPSPNNPDIEWLREHATQPR
jgi:prepilin-type processing-associated H-X9-DG protein